MGLFAKSNGAESKQLKASAELCRKRDTLEAELPRIQQKWDERDEAGVLPLAGKLAALQLAQSPAKLLATRQELQAAIWERDQIRSEHEKELNALVSEIELLNAPIISARVQSWQRELAGLDAHRVVEVSEKFIDHAKDRNMVKIRSNSDAVLQAKQGLTAAIKQLRAMSTTPLAEIHRFVEETEARLKSLDFSKLVTAEPVSQGVYDGIIDRPDPTVQLDQTATNWPREAAAQKLLRRTAL